MKKLIAFGYILLSVAMITVTIVFMGLVVKIVVNLFMFGFGLW